MRISDWSSDVCSSDLIVFCLCIALFGFIAGSFLMYRDVFPATYLAQSYQGGLALLDKATGYEDPLATDLWNPARTDARSAEERRVGKACVRTCRSRWSPYHSKKKT